MNLANLLLRTARGNPTAPAVALGDRTLHAYGELAARVERLAGGLLRGGLTPGDRVALVMKNCPQYVELLFACWHAGLVAVPANAKLHARELAYVLEHSDASCCFVTQDLFDSIAPLRAELPELRQLTVVGSSEYEQLLATEPVPPAAVASSDLAWLFYTSGTTGRPKGAMLSHRNLMTMTLCYTADVDRIDPGDSILHAAPMSHGSGLYILPHVAHGACQVIPASGGFDPEEMFTLLRCYRGMSFFAAPTMVTRLMNHPAAATADLTGLKTIIYGGGPMYLEDCKRAIAVFGDRLVQIYGQGESPMTITALNKRHFAEHGHPRFDARLSSVGVPQTAVEVIVADDDDRPLPPGERGEVLVRGDSVMSGYWRNPEATADTLRGGWLHTGDVGALDEEGFLTLKDRSKDVIISGGSNIYPREVEEVLLQHRDVLEAAVVGRPHADLGEAVLAFVVARPGGSLNVQELEALCLQHIARFKRPKEYRLVDALPKNNYGKVLKTELRRILAESSDQA